ncbi:hypothetical protein XM38_033870 [Halomicronema hongdechloris C2206]|uniref:Recombinase domain-containing protein n=1 Tax=Halomicronema hongdechloris C2206 TaxID=1641165 RepID=A0A1Z3HQ36_9CYAN|nr:recombinase family protein [Halomicronema hongdechloris]ASC72430.1 hypothetical protein XM38_033870 [Halomicronema hongdechloris C2206]
MRVVAYLCSNALLESVPAPTVWGDEVDEVYSDRGPWSPPIDRPNLRQLLQDAQVAPPDYVLVRRLEELGDSLETVADRLAQLEGHGVTVIATEQDYPPQNGADNGTETFSHAMTRHQSLWRLSASIQRQQQRQRLQQGHARNRLKALPPPGKAPYGYRRGKDRYALDRAAAPVVRDFFDHFLLFGSVRGAVRHMNAKYGKRIAVSTGHRWLTNPIYRGDLQYHDGGIIQNTHAPILSRQEAAQVDRLLLRNRRLPPRTASAPRSLAGLVVCQRCQSAMRIARVTTPRQQREYLYLRPAACAATPPCRALPYQAVLEKTITAICQELPQAVAALMQASPAAPEDAAVSGPSECSATDLATKQSALEQLPELVTKGILDQDTADLRAYRLHSEIAQLRQQQAQQSPVNLQELAQTVSIPQFWLDLSEAERRFFFREFIRQIQIVREEASWHIALDFIF